jgi:hypothetical protein
VEFTEPKMVSDKYGILIAVFYGKLFAIIYGKILAVYKRLVKTNNWRKRLKIVL